MDLNSCASNSSILKLDNDEKETSLSDVEMQHRVKKPGIIYLSSIPIGMNPQLVRDFLGVYGELGKSYLQPVSKPGGGRKIRYSEGWVEFKSKRKAKLVAEYLNNKKVGGKKRSKYHDALWTIRYLPGFKWAHLSERLAYEKAVRHQRMQNEIAQVKRETAFFIDSVEKRGKVRKKATLTDGWAVTQRIPEEEIKEAKAISSKSSRAEFLKHLFQPNAS